MQRSTRRDFLKAAGCGAVCATVGQRCAASPQTAGAEQTRPNILFCIADDWSWPHASIAGHPEDGGEPYCRNRAYGDIDDSPTKTYMMEHRDQPQSRRLFKLAFEKRPAEELYDLRKDPDQLNNVAGDPLYADVKKELEAKLTAQLKVTGDPRVLGRGDVFDKYPYYGGQQPKRE